jgi:hypothetical protein
VSTGRLYSAEEARALLEGANDITLADPGSFCGGSWVECSLAGDCHGEHPTGRLTMLEIDAGEETERIYVAEPGDAALLGAAPDLAATVVALHTERRETMRRVRVVLAHFGVDDCDDPLAALEEMPERSDAVVAAAASLANELALQVAALRARVPPSTGGAWHEGAAVYLRADAHTPCAMAVDEAAARRIVLALNSLPVTP